MSDDLDLEEMREYAQVDPMGEVTRWHFLRLIDEVQRLQSQLCRSREQFVEVDAEQFAEAVKDGGVRFGEPVYVFRSSPRGQERGLAVYAGEIESARRVRDENEKTK